MTRLHPPAVPGAAGTPAAMRFIMGVVLIDMLAVGIIVPVLPALVGNFTRSPSEQTWWYGVIALSYALASFFGAPVLGALSDRYGRRPVLLLGFCGLAINFFSTALATSAWVLVASRIVGAPCRPMWPWPMPMWPTSPRPSSAPSASAWWGRCSASASFSAR